MRLPRQARAVRVLGSQSFRSYPQPQSPGSVSFPIRDPALTPECWHGGESRVLYGSAASGSSFGGWFQLFQCCNSEGPDGLLGPWWRVPPALTLLELSVLISEPVVLSTSSLPTVQSPPSSAFPLSSVSLPSGSSATAVCTPQPSFQVHPAAQAAQMLATAGLLLLLSAHCQSPISHQRRSHHCAQV